MRCSVSPLSKCIPIRSSELLCCFAPITSRKSRTHAINQLIEFLLFPGIEVQILHLVNLVLAFFNCTKKSSKQFSESTMTLR